MLEQELETITANEIKQLGTMINVESKIFNISWGKDVEPALNGKYYLYILVSDEAGNDIITSKAFLFDNSLPVVEIVVEDRFYANTEEFEVVIDDESTITSYEYAWVKADTEIDLSKIVFEVVAENKIPASLILADGEYKLIVKVTDEAGNVSEVCVSEVFKFDVSSPVVTGVENNGYYKDLVKIEVKDINEVTLMLNGTEIENGTELATSGFYSLIVVDALGNEIVVNFVINTTGKSKINNKSVKVERQQYAPIKCDEEGRCSIEVARGTYTKDSVIVLTKGTEDGYVMLDQDTNHVSISKDLKSTLSIRKYQLEVADETVISQEADANGYYGYVNLHVVTFESAVKLGVEKTVIDNESVTLTLGLTGSFALIGIYFITRVKKQRI